MFANPLINTAAKFYGFFLSIGSNLQSLFLLYMRLTWGHQFLLTGMKKLSDIPSTAKFFATLHIPAPLFHAYEVGILEVMGGLCLILGFASRLITIPLIIILLTALSTAHATYLANFQFVINPQILAIQSPYPFLITCFLVFIFGPGRVSLDAWIKRWADHQPKY